MRIAITGYGKMGRMVENLLQDDHHEVVAVIDDEQDWQTKIQDFRRAQVAIDFSMPAVVVSNMYRAFENQVPMVVGTTGWSDRLNEVCSQCRKFNGSLIYGSNFSIGANLFMQLNIILAQMMEKQPQYCAQLEETHHTAKKDAPSGTAIKLAEDLISVASRLQSWKLTDQPVDEDVLPVQAHRVGEVPGIHTIQWRSEEDDIVITHSAHSRIGFAKGAVRAAIWLVDHPGIYDFSKIAAMV